MNTRKPHFKQFIEFQSNVSHFGQPQRVPLYGLQEHNYSILDMEGTPQGDNHLSNADSGKKNKLLKFGQSVLQRLPSTNLSRQKPQQTQRTEQYKHKLKYSAIQGMGSDVTLTVRAALLSSEQLQSTDLPREEPDAVRGISSRLWHTIYDPPRLSYYEKKLVLDPWLKEPDIHHSLSQRLTAKECKRLKPCLKDSGTLEDLLKLLNSDTGPSSDCQEVGGFTSKSKEGLDGCVRYLIYSSDGTEEKVVIKGSAATRKEIEHLDAVTYFTYNNKGNETGFHHVLLHETESCKDTCTLSQNAYHYVPFIPINGTEYDFNNTSLGSCMSPDPKMLWKDHSVTSSCKMARSTSCGFSQSVKDSYTSVCGETQSGGLQEHQVLSSCSKSQSDLSGNMWSPVKVFSQHNREKSPSRNGYSPTGSRSCASSSSSSSLSSVDEVDALLYGPQQTSMMHQPKDTGKHFAKFIPLPSLSKEIPKLLLNKVDKQEWLEAQAAFVKQCKVTAIPSTSDSILLQSVAQQPTRAKGSCFANRRTLLRWNSKQRSSAPTTSVTDKRRPAPSAPRFSLQLNEPYVKQHVAVTSHYSAMLFVQLPSCPNFDLCNVKTELLVAALRNFFHPHSDVQCMWIPDLHEKLVDLLKDCHFRPLFNRIVFLRHFDAVLALSADAVRLLRHRDTCFTHSLAAVLEIQARRLLILHKTSAKGLVEEATYSSL